jgi:hypothetical protein
MWRAPVHYVVDDVASTGAHVVHDVASIMITGPRRYTGRRRDENEPAEAARHRYRLIGIGVAVAVQVDEDGAV